MDVPSEVFKDVPKDFNNTDQMASLAVTTYKKEMQLTFAPPLYFCQKDLFGPTRVFVPGKEREMRHGKPAVSAKCSILMFVWPTIYIINTTTGEGMASGTP